MAGAPRRLATTGYCKWRWRPDVPDVCPRTRLRRANGGALVIPAPDLPPTRDCGGALMFQKSTCRAETAAP